MAILRQRLDRSPRNARADSSWSEATAIFAEDLSNEQFSLSPVASPAGVGEKVVVSGESAATILKQRLRDSSPSLSRASSLSSGAGVAEKDVVSGESAASILKQRLRDSSPRSRPPATPHLMRNQQGESCTTCGLSLHSVRRLEAEVQRSSQLLSEAKVQASTAAATATRDTSAAMAEGSPEPTQQVDKCAPARVLRLPA